jgi:transposase
MQINNNFIKKSLDLQDLDIIYFNVNNGIFNIFATSSNKQVYCPRCGHITNKVHDRRYQDYEHLPIWNLKTIISLEIKRYKCSCNPEHLFTETFNFIRKHQRRTIAYEKYIFTLAHKNTIQNVADIIGISHGTCQRIYNFYAKDKLELLEPEPLTLLGIDDIAKRKGHNYNTVIYNQATGNPVTVISGRRKGDVVPYLSSLPQEVKENIQAVSMDMSRSYCYSVLESLPNAKPVIDRFHLSQKLHKDTDDARKHIQNHIKKHHNKDEVFKIRWALLKNLEDLTENQLLNLITACNKYPQLAQLHYLKEEFRNLFKIKTKEKAIAFIDYFKKLVTEFDISELKSFCSTLDNWLPYILNYYDYPISNGIVEGNNHKIKNIKRRGYGYRNQENFYLRVHLEFKYA